MQVLDLGKSYGGKSYTSMTFETLAKRCAARRDPPLTPDDFVTTLNTKSFTNKKADCDYVGTLYKDEFEQLLTPSEQLNYASLTWGNEDVSALCKVVQDIRFPSLKRLWLNNNQIGDQGARSLSIVLRYLPKLKEVTLANNKIGDAGANALCEALLMARDLHERFIKSYNKGGVGFELSDNPISQSVAAKLPEGFTFD